MKENEIKNSIKNRVEPDVLEKISQSFFQTFGTRNLLGNLFFNSLAIKNRQIVFEDLINTCGYQNNIEGFFQNLTSKIFTEKKIQITINRIIIPPLYLYHILEAILPGNRLYAIKNIDDLKKNARVFVNDPDKLQQVMDQFPVRLSDHVIRQALVSCGVAKQYLPFIEELDPTGDTITFDGHFKHGVLEQMYENRVIFLLDMHCPVYCRFCFRKHKATRKEKTPGPSDVMAAVDHVKNHSAIKEILITGGDPLLNRPSLDAALNGLKDIAHVNVIRIATRSIAYYPQLFLKGNREYIHYLIEQNDQLKSHGKRIEIGMHFVHPDEVSIQSLDIISDLVKNGVQVYVQTPFLNGLNTEGKTLGRLFSLLRNAGAKIYYIFTPCSPIHGTKPYWAPISKAIKAIDYLRDNFSDRVVPKLCTATPLGKIEWHTSGWAVQQDEKDSNFIWIRTPYTKAYYQQFVLSKKDMPVYRENDEGTLDARFRVDMGDKALFAGNRPSTQKIQLTQLNDRSLIISNVRTKLLQTSPLRSSVEDIPIAGMSRIHKSCVEMSIPVNEKALEYLANQYLADQGSVSDVILHLDDKALLAPKRLKDVLIQIKKSPHITCIRLCCRQFNDRPHLITPELIHVLTGVCDFSIAHPFRVEVETWVLLPKDIEQTHKELAAKMIKKGIHIYANAPLIQGVNDDPDTIIQLAHRLRHTGIEFHHLYVGGLAIQKNFNSGETIDPKLLIDIASKIRTSCSGREIPLYIIRTPDGDEQIDLTDFFKFM
ncbi:MAG: radical SAM protein [Desulfobacula sp.]|nr:radical SAM protein [Desulfobacula sp.]